ncbi:MAG: cell division protein FtsZ [Bacteroidales bacterium]|nr:cell division protein FtsZ [Bacteroidales bacterium]MDY2932333.1 cell division protein FtsZ [Muribaculaceae bacterium]MDD6131695.1 cell division protein FtsZ [Bacteroidales bacterium]MDD6851317.1 cell division protein FtsZ [Bacteroidales bacterium]MDD7405628.1 cell division protein FtsZ [Bacteroidales bacterium]
MEEDYRQTPELDISRESGIEKPTPVIKVIGVGGGGNNAINHMYRQDISDVSFVVCNTDAQALKCSPVPNKLLIGPNTTKGQGAGNVPEVARAAAEESANEIAELFKDGTSMVFVTAGMGGGTGTGAAPVVARIARENDILTVGIVTIPFLFEGEKKILKALNGADEMSKYVDALLVINNERLTDIYGDLDFSNGFAKADDILSIAAQSISEIITVNGKINLDLNDVSTTLKDGGVALISRGYGEGENRITKAIQDALNSPLLRNRDIEGSKKILFNIYYNPNDTEKPFKMSELNEFTSFMNQFSDMDVIWGVSYDETLGSKVRITILASGFSVTITDDKEFRTQPAESTETSAQTTTNEVQRIAEEYGSDKVNAQRQQQARARYIILTPDQFDKEDVLAIFERYPTYNRDSKVKDLIREASKNSNDGAGDNLHVSDPATIVF